MTAIANPDWKGFPKGVEPTYANYVALNQGSGGQPGVGTAGAQLANWWNGTIPETGMNPQQIALSQMINPVTSQLFPTAFGGDSALSNYLNSNLASRTEALSPYFQVLAAKPNWQDLVPANPSNGMSEAEFELMKMEMQTLPLIQSLPKGYAQGLFGLGGYRKGPQDIAMEEYNAKKASLIDQAVSASLSPIADESNFQGVTSNEILQNMYRAAMNNEAYTKPDNESAQQVVPVSEYQTKYNWAPRTK